MHTSAEIYGFGFMIFMYFIPPIFVLLYLQANYPLMEFKRTVSFIVGWIPGNLLALGYWLSTCVSLFSIVDFVFLLLYIEVVQICFAVIIGRIFVSWFGEEAFR